MSREERVMSSEKSLLIAFLREISGRAQWDQVLRPRVGVAGREVAGWGARVWWM